jgi:drug/metabolite transporter (DMT)-like permease
MQKFLQWQAQIVLIIGVLSVSTAAIFIRACIEAGNDRSLGFSLLIACCRLLFASVFLLPTWRTFQRDRYSITAYYWAIAAGCCLASHFAAWITSLSFTSIAASTTLVTTTPIWVTIISWLWLGEKPKKLTLLGIAIALGGSVIITLGDSNTNNTHTNPLLGNCLALIGTILASLYFLLGREAQRNGLGIGHYSAIAYTTAALLLLPLPGLLGTNYFSYPREVYFYLFLMAIFAQLIGHTSLNWAIAKTSPIIVTLTVLFEPIPASYMGWFIFGELPSAFTLQGGIILLLGVAIGAIAQNQKQD